MKRIAFAFGLLVALCVCSVAEARVRNVTIVRRQRVVAAPQAVIVQRPLQLVTPQTHVFVPSQQLIIVR